MDEQACKGVVNMTRQEFRALFNKGIVFLDGATGTQMHKSGMPTGACPEKWAVENPEPLMRVQRDYLAAGSQIIYTFSMGGNALKMAEYGLEAETYAINKRLAEISKEALQGKALVAGDLSSSGSLLYPNGDLSFEDSVNSYKAQIKGLLDGGVDLFAIETMLDIQETRSALIAIRELCNLPVIVTMTFETGLTTLMGTDPISALVTLQSLGADAVGCNCSSGPAEMVDILKLMKPYAKVPLLAKPNAGKPKLQNGRTVFDMNSDTFCSYVESLVNAGANGLGGCCGTSPDYIAKMASIARKCTPKGVSSSPCSLASSNRMTAFIHPEYPLTVIGERLNPTGKKALKEALIKKDMDTVAALAKEQTDAGAALLDVNAGVPGIDETETLVAMVHEVVSAVPLPICLDSSSPEALEAALRIYPGRAVINSISGETVKIEKILPLAAKYGAMFILLPVDDSGVPQEANERIAIIQKVMEKAAAYGLAKEDILVDGVAMTVAANQSAAGETLKVISWCTAQGINTVLGLSNISFGLPERELINTAFLSMAAASGLSSAIMNPNNEGLMHAKRALDVLKSRDQNALEYIRYHSSHQGSRDKQAAPPARGEITLFDSVVEGLADKCTELVVKALEEGGEPQKIVNETLIPAIQKVGDLYDARKYFLPQLIRGAEVMEKAMAVLTPLLETSGGDVRQKGTIVIATVKGDVHDIGKNIVALLLRNYGFKVLDLGKDVPSDAIIQAAKDHDADIIAMSALMTTTMTEMPKVAALAREAGLKAKIMVGGAVLDQEYASLFQGHYSRDAYTAVKLAESLL